MTSDTWVTVANTSFWLEYLNSLDRVVHLIPEVSSLQAGPETKLVFEHESGGKK